MKHATLDARVRDHTLSPELLDRLHTEPWRFGFLSLLRRIGADAEIDRVGTARRPRAEPFRLGQQPTLAFAPREIASVNETAGRLKVRLFGLGMLGPNGPLPIHVTEMAKDREDSRRDTTTVDFLDLFHHRFLALFYRAWASAQATAGLDRRDDEHFSFYVATLAGRDTAEIGRRPLPSHARLAASAHLVRESRNPDGLRATLEHYFGVPVAIEENVFHWIEIDSADRGRMGQPGPAATMGHGAILGRVAPDRQHRFRIVIGPVDLEAYLRFTPQGEDLPQLIEWVRAFVGHELEWELELRIRPDSAPPAVMGGAQRIGWSGWLGCPGPHEPITGMRFEPERHARRATRQPTDSRN
ncbi:type VI secretion system baseplate subunit TssG [Burkholderia diffusa]|uniref:type VI secretion system baseplate subunit TssG n=1 Tax=Burkholderia diffusa TaxID=488732 RepID=UPI0008415463|nr:type VI secretion system baseplate subunit TssG [Burkholderia diffusa]AOI60337.1 type VI secretion protein [Burkholderia diffusa]